MTLTRRELLASAAGAAALACLYPRTTSAAEVATADGWIDLFDGKMLTGWHKNPKKIGHGTGGQWTVEPDGVLAGEQDPPGSGNGGIFLTDQRFGDFELSIEMKPTWGVDTGVFLRCTDQGQCIQMMVDYYDNGSIGHLYGEATGAWNTKTFSLKGELENGKLKKLTTVGPVELSQAGVVKSCTGPQWVDAWKIDDWNKAHIRVEGGAFPHITTHINDLLVCEFDAATAKLDKYDKDKVHETLGNAGFVAVQVHGGNRYPAGSKCRYRNIRIRPASA